MSFQFQIPRKVRTGRGALTDFLAAASAYGTRALIVTGRHVRQLDAFRQLTDGLGAHHIAFTVFDGIPGEPDDAMIAAGADAYRASHCDFLIAMGGGSPMDAMKAIAVTAGGSRGICSYYGQSIDCARPPMIAIPTTAGTGSEATQFTVITERARGIKMLLKGPALLPDEAVVDGALTVGAPPSVVSATALDALTHATEAYTSRRAQPLTDALCVSAVQRIFRALPAAYRAAQGDAIDAETRACVHDALAVAALEAGIAINNSSVTIVHGMSRPIGALYHVPHGLSNAMLLHRCMAFAAGLDDPDADRAAVARFAALGRAVGAAQPSDEDETAAAAYIHALGRICKLCDVPTPVLYGINPADFADRIDKMADDALASGSPANTRRPVTKSDILALYRAILS